MGLHHALAALLAFAGTALADKGPEAPVAPPPSEQLGALSLEQLLAVPVSSVRRREENLGRSAGAVFVITQDDLRRSGVTTIPEALRMVPGVEVARFGAQSWAISARGFNWLYSSKLLVMIDGRTVYNPIFGGVYWDSLDTLIEDIERIEVMRGPGAAMWGANAVNGVINIITKPARLTQGTLVSLGAGQDTRSRVGARFGAPAGDKGFFRVYGQQRLEIADASLDESYGNARWSMTQGGFRADWNTSERDAVTVQADAFRSGSRLYNLLATARRDGAEVPDRPTAWGGNALTRWEHTHRDRSVSTLQVYADQYTRSGNLFDLSIFTLDADFQHRRALGARQELSFGAGARQIHDSINSTPSTTINPSRLNYSLWHFTLQDDVSIVRDRLSISGAVRFERNTFTGWSAQPTIRLLWTPSARQTLWTAVSHAVRTPAHAEMGLDNFFSRRDELNGLPVFALLSGNPRLGNELSYTVEAGHRYRLGRRLTWDIATHASRYSGLQEPVLRDGQVRLGAIDGIFGLVLPLQATNTLSAHSYGTETVARYSLRRDWRLSGTWTWLRMTAWSKSPDIKLLGPLSVVGHYPEHSVSARSEWSFARRGEFGLGYSRVGALLTTGTSVLGYHRVDARVSWSLTELAEISAGIDNLAHCACREFSMVPGPAYSAIRPGAYVRLTFRP